MNISEFIESLKENEAPSNLSYSLKALWVEANGDWEGAHELVQNDQEGDGAWVHAYLHRKEGDQWNAGYWYRRAGRPVATQSLNKEWEDIATELLRKSEK